MYFSITVVAHTISSSCGFLGASGNLFISGQVFGIAYREIERAGDNFYDVRIRWPNFMVMMLDFGLQGSDDPWYMCLRGNFCCFTHLMFTEVRLML